MLKKFVYTQETVDLARVACGLERYRLVHGSYPEKLDEIVPQFISQVLHDIIGGQPLHYHLTNKDEFILYSVGWDNTDDGGVVALNEHQQWVNNKWVIPPNDWVWQYPQK